MGLIEIKVKNVKEPKYKAVLNEILAGDFSYTPEGSQVDSETFVIKFHAGEYAVVSDELLNKKQSELVNPDSENRYTPVFNALPRTVSVEEGDSVTVSIDN